MKVGIFDLDDNLLTRRAIGERKGKNIFIEILRFILVCGISWFLGVLVSTIGIIIYAYLTGNINRFLSGDLEIINDPVMLLMILILTGIISIIVILVFVRIEKRSIYTLGFVSKDWAKEYFKGLGIGFLIISLVVLINLLTGSVKWDGFMDSVNGRGVSYGLLVGYFISAVILGIGEELLFRGYLCIGISRKSPMFVATIISSIIFAGYNLIGFDISINLILPLLNLFLLGIFLTIYMVKRGSIWSVAGINLMWFFAPYSIYGVDEHSIGKIDSIFEISITEGRELLNGGQYGIQGSIITTIVLVISLFIVLKMKSKRG